MIIGCAMYYGPPIGFYSRDNFREFATGDLVRRLTIKGLDSKCNVEVNSSCKTTFHLPGRGVGILYETHEVSLARVRCKVTVIGRDKNKIEEVVETIIDAEEAESS